VSELALDITFAGVSLTQQGGIKVLDIHRTILPSRENYSIDIPYKHGAYYTGYKYQPRQIAVDIAIISSDMDASMRALAWMLDLAEPSPLIFSDEPDKQYYAVVDGDTEIESVLTVGKGTITFLCLDPFAYSLLEKTYSPDTNGKFTINNGGTAPSAPKFDVSFTADCGYVAFVSPNGVIQIGNPKDVDGIKLPDSERLINDGMGSTTGWTVNTSGKSRTTGAVIQGTVTSDGSVIKPNSFGTAPNASTWHGMTIRKDIGTTADLTNSAQYWEATFDFKFMSASTINTAPENKQIGKIEFNIMDTNNNFLAGFTMKDVFEGYQFNIPEFYVGSTQIWNDTPTIPKPTTVRQYNPITRKYENKTVAPVNVGIWNDFNGKVIIRKTGTQFYFELQKIDPTTKKITQRVTKTYYDTAGTYTSVKAKTVNIWFGKWGNYAVINTNNADNVTFRKDNVADFKDLPNLFGNGDRLTVDCGSSQVYLNDALFMDKVDIGSTFFELVEGTTEVQFLHSSYSSTNKPTVTAKLTEKFL
jgi:predicted phage tail component-like protein